MERGLVGGDGPGTLLGPEETDPVPSQALTSCPARPRSGGGAGWVWVPGGC